MGIGEVKGNLIVNIQVKPHKMFTMKDSTTPQSILSVPLKRMLEGCRESVLTLYGIKDVIVPPGTQPGDELRIKNCGVNKQSYHAVVIGMPIYPSKQELNDKWNGKKIKCDFKLQEEYNKEMEEFENTFVSLGGLGGGDFWNMPEWRPGQ